MKGRQSFPIPHIIPRQKLHTKLVICYEKKKPLCRMSAYRPQEYRGQHILVNRAALGHII